MARTHAVGPHGDRAHGSLLSYVIIWVILLALTALTYALSKAPLGNWHVPVALMIAGTKSALVITFFMHLKDHSPVNRAFFLLSLVFVVLLISGVLSDVATRLPTANPDFGAPMEP
jgi:cytochrome c oxidase subunit IV